MGRGQRLNFLMKGCETPGPGQYMAPSQFGYYISKNAEKPMPECKRQQKIFC